MLFLSRLIACVSGFIVLDNTNYTDISAIGYGAIKTNFVPARFCEPLTWKDGKTVLPPKNEWLDLVQKYDPTDPHSEGYLILDCEKLYFNGDPDQISHNFEITKQLQKWVREIRPNRTLGWYGFSNVAFFGHSYPEASFEALKNLIDLDNGKTAYFPTAYILKSGDTPYLSSTSWSEAIKEDLVHIRRIEELSSTEPHPAFPYIWPQYYDDKHSLVPASDWHRILETLLGTGYEGTIIWGGQNPNEKYNRQNGGSGPWLEATHDFLDSNSFD